jgi:hypothetical protein
MSPAMWYNRVTDVTLLARHLGGAPKSLCTVGVAEEPNLTSMVRMDSVVGVDEQSP